MVMTMVTQVPKTVPTSGTPVAEMRRPLQNRQVRAGAILDVREWRPPARTRRDAPGFEFEQPFTQPLTAAALGPSH